MAAHPKTLLEMAGAPNVPARFEEAAVIVIDAQGEYLDGALPLTGIGPALDAVAVLLKAARAAGAPVIHIAHKGRPGALFDRDGPGGRIVDQAAPVAGETVIEKALPNSFAGTDLKAALDATGRKKLIVAGFMTHMCVSATVRAGLDLGYMSTVVADAAATRDLPDPVTGEAVAAGRIHAIELAALADRFAIVAPLNKILA